MIYYTGKTYFTSKEEYWAYRLISQQNKDFADYKGGEKPLLAILSQYRPIIFIGLQN